MEESRTALSIKLIVLYALLFFGVFGGFFVLKAVTGTEYPIMIVVSQSMEPTLGVGDYIFVWHEDVDSIKVGPKGDIIVFIKPFSLQGEFIVHRAVEKFQRDGVVFFQTHGDNNPPNCKEEVPASNVIGTVYGRVPLLGYFSLFERTSGGIITIVILVSLILFLAYIVPLNVAETTTVSAGVKRWSLTYLTVGLLLVSALPYPALLILRGGFIPFEVVALLCWYACNLLIPLSVKDDDALMLWLYHFALVIIPVGSDLIYRLTGITPSEWWFSSYGTVPIIWGLSNETTLYYRYLTMLGALLLAGCIIFFLSWGMNRRGQPILRILRPP